MSIIAKTLAPCSKCGENQEITVYRSINVSENPELKEKVKDGSLFVWKCGACSQPNLAKYETLYHDPEKNIMIWLLPTGELPEAQMNAITNHAKAMGGYTLRRVSNVGELMEKVMLFDEGLDDIAVEMCKYVTKLEMAAKTEEGKRNEIMNIPMHFYRLDERDGVKFLTLSLPDGDRMVGMNIGYNVYEDCLAILGRNPSIRETEGFAKIDSDWINSIMA